MRGLETSADRGIPVHEAAVIGLPAGSVTLIAFLLGRGSSDDAAKTVALRRVPARTVPVSAPHNRWLRLSVGHGAAATTVLLALVPLVVELVKALRGGATTTARARDVRPAR